MYSNDEKNSQKKSSLPEHKVIPFSVKQFHVWEDAIQQLSKEIRWGDNLLASKSMPAEEAEKKEKQAVAAQGLIPASGNVNSPYFSEGEAKQLAEERDVDARESLWKQISTAKKAAPAARAMESAQKPMRVQIERVVIPERFKEVMNRHKSNHVFIDAQGYVETTEPQFAKRVHVWKWLTASVRNSNADYLIKHVVQYDVAKLVVCLYDLTKDVTAEMKLDFSSER